MQNANQAICIDASRKKSNRRAWRNLDIGIDKIGDVLNKLKKWLQNCTAVATDGRR
jgi:hypothetical protein